MNTNDPTESTRRLLVSEINNAVESSDPNLEKARLEAVYGKGNVFDTAEVREKFEVVSFMAPFVTCKRKSDGKHGAMEFQHHPRFYFNFADC